MKHPSLLPFRPLPRPLESAIGYLLRLGAANDFPSLSWLQAYCKHLALPAQGFEDFIAGSTGHSVEELLNLWGPSCSTLPIGPKKLLGIKTIYWNLHLRRWCPLCLREHGYWRAEWLLTLQIGCPIHQCLLLDRCPSCARPVSWYSGEVLQCRCSHPLTEGTTESLPASLARATEWVSTKFSTACSGYRPLDTDPEPASTLLAELHLARLLDLLWALGCYVHHRELGKPLKVQNHHRLAIVQPILTSAADILADWPAAFHRFMDKLVDPSQQHALDLRQFLGIHLQALSKALNHPELHFVRIEFERFVSERWKGVIAERHHFIVDDISLQHPVITANEASEIMGISRQKLATLVSARQIHGWYQHSPGTRRYLVVDRASVERFRQGSAGALFTLTDTARYLGTTRPRVRLFVESSLIHPCYTPGESDNGHSHWMFQKAELDQLLGGLSLALHPTPDCASLMSLEEICRGRTRDGADLVTLLRALQNQTLTVVARDPCKPGLQGLLLNRQQFESWFVAILPEKDQFALAAASQYLGIKEHVLYWLRDRGLLHGFVHSDNDGKPRLTRQALDSFKQLYVWGRSLGQLTGFGEKSASRAMLNQGVWPITGPTVDGGTTYLFLRADVMAYLDRRERAAVTGRLDEIQLNIPG
ncbi:TniQ family protein [Paludibacterium sp. B53371]|uniref:TniQ family protein n=1 Tax=Paludibacterium sp. B53371 TaxID=2806263 RepID=UPI001C0464EF|nr:TniQ family protein [Paludibacterium sp. B53371]